MEKHVEKLKRLLAEKKYAQALATGKTGLKKYPESAQLLLGCGDASRHLEQYMDAAAYYTKAARAGGQNAHVFWLYAGNAYDAAKKRLLAVDAYRRGLALNADYELCLNNLVCALYAEGLLLDAVPYARRLLELSTEPTHSMTAGYVLRGAALHDEALTAFRNALRMTPDHWPTIAAALQAAQYGYDWEEVARLTNLYTTKLYSVGNYEEGHELHLVNVAWCMDEAINYGVAKAAVLHSDGLQQPKYSHANHQWGERLRIGYVSADFRNHAILHLIGGVMAFHDKKTVEVFAYCHSKHDSSWGRKRFLNAVEHYVPTHEMTDAELAQRIYDDKIDVLVDLQGYTDKNRLGVFTLRPAPVQVTYLGFPGTSGADFFDYAITDPVVTPDSSKPWYTEKLCRLPEQYQCNDQERFVAANEFTRASQKLPDDAFVFCCFNQSYKIDELMFDCWMRILRDVPGSVLWILDPGLKPTEVLRKEAEKRGVTGDRIIVAERESAPMHLKRGALADLMLDTRVYNGHTVTSDALWVGVPVVTCQGTHFASRVASSLLRAIGLEECIATSLEQMHDIAVDLAVHPQKMSALRAKLVTNRAIKPLFDTGRITSHLEDAYRAMAERAQQGLPPDHIDIPARPERTVPFMGDIPQKHIALIEARKDILEQRAQGNTLQVPFGQCPLCQTINDTNIKACVFDIEILSSQRKPSTYWVQCSACSHVYSRYYWTEEALLDIYNDIERKTLSGDPSLSRSMAGRFVEQVLDVAKLDPYSDTALKWMSVYPHNAWIPIVAQEMGFAVTTLFEPQWGNDAKQFGIAAAEADYLTLNMSGKPDVVCLDGILERIPFPDLYLSRAHSLLSDTGILVVSATNAASVLWKMNEANSKSPSLEEIDRLHLYSAKILLDLVAKQFKVLRISVREDMEAGIVIVARKIR